MFVLTHGVCRDADKKHQNIARKGKELSASSNIAVSEGVSNAESTDLHFFGKKYVFIDEQY